MFVYLSDCEAGGATHFPLAGVQQAPVCGHALCWHNINKRGLLDGRTLHAGLPVERGVKWGMNVWLRQQPRVMAHDSNAPGWASATAPPLTATTQNGRTAETLREVH